MHDTSSLPVSLFQQAVTCFQQARYVDSIQYYLSGLKYDTSKYHIYADLAKAYEMVGNWKQALIYLDIAQQLCPESKTVLRRKSRIIEERDFYQTLIYECNLSKTPPTDFKPTIQPDNTTRSRYICENKYYLLKIGSDITFNTLWNICQLIEKTYLDIGKKLNCFPKTQANISMKNTRYFPLDSNEPNWVSGIYDGDIRVNYCSEDAPELGVLYVLIRHEWTHLIVEMLTNGKCPNWLNEGLAQTMARPLFNHEKLSLQKADNNNQLPSISDMNRPFSELSASERKIAYLQSAAIVNVLINAGGFQKIQKLLSLIKNGTQIDKALSQIYRKCEIPI